MYGTVVDVIKTSAGDLISLVFENGMCVNFVFGECLLGFKDDNREELEELMGQCVIRIEKEWLRSSDYCTFTVTCSRSQLYIRGYLTSINISESFYDQLQYESVLRDYIAELRVSEGF